MRDYLKDHKNIRICGDSKAITVDVLGTWSRLLLTLFAFFWFVVDVILATLGET